MKTMQIIAIAMLISSGIILVHFTANFELSEKYFEDQRNGLMCNKPGSNCPYPDFEDPMLYSMLGLAIFVSGIILSIFKSRSISTCRVLITVSLASGIPALVAGVLAYSDDYSHYMTISEKCSLNPCMTPNVFSNMQFVEFYIISGSILSALGVILFVTYFWRTIRR